MPGRRRARSDRSLIGTIQEASFRRSAAAAHRRRQSEVARQAIRAAQRLVRENFAPDLILALGRPGAGRRSRRRHRAARQHRGADDRRRAEDRGVSRSAPRAAVGAAADRDRGGRADPRGQPPRGGRDDPSPHHCLAQQAARRPSRHPHRPDRCRAAAGRGDRRALPFVSGARAAARKVEGGDPSSRRCGTRWSRSSNASSG